MIVLDTSALLYWTLDPAQLSSKASKVIQGAGRIMVSSISIWEIALKVKRQKLILPLTVADYVERLQLLEALEILSRNLVARVRPVEKLHQVKDVGRQKQDAVRNPLRIAEADRLRLPFAHRKKFQVAQLGMLHRAALRLGIHHFPPAFRRVANSQAASDSTVTRRSTGVA